VVKVGYRRFWLHQTMYELYDWLTQDLTIAVSEREILNVIGDFLALLRAGQAAEVRTKLTALKDLVIGLDGMQPEKGNTCLYIVRELRTGLTLSLSLFVYTGSPEKVYTTAMTFPAVIFPA
jgi:hypothetical protein